MLKYLIILLLVPFLSFADVRCYTGTLAAGTGANLTIIPTDIDTLMHIRDVYNYVPQTLSNNITCIDNDSGASIQHFVTVPNILKQYNTYVSLVPSYSMSVVDKELSELRALTFQDWVVISLAIVGLMALTSVFVQIKRVIR